MSIVPPPSGKPSPSTDRTLLEAQEELQKDLARIQQGHVVTWDYEPFGGMKYWCSCPKKGPRDRNKLEAHLIHAIEAERGATRPPTK